MRKVENVKFESNIMYILFLDYMHQEFFFT